MIQMVHSQAQIPCNLCHKLTGTGETLAHKRSKQGNDRFVHHVHLTCLETRIRRAAKCDADLNCVICKKWIDDSPDFSITSIKKDCTPKSILRVIQLRNLATRLAALFATTLVATSIILIGRGTISNIQTILSTSSQRQAFLITVPLSLFTLPASAMIGFQTGIFMGRFLGNISPRLNLGMEDHKKRVQLIGDTAIILTYTHAFAAYGFRVPASDLLALSCFQATCAILAGSFSQDLYL